jgi:plastocyanin
VTRRGTWLLVVLGLLSSCAPIVTTGTLRGTLAVPRSWRAQDAVVWLETVPESTGSVRASRRATPGSERRFPSIVAKDQRFDPRLIVIAAGDTLLFRNADRVWHGPFSVSPGNPFDRGKRAPGQLDSLTFATPGEVQVRCDIHPEMSATVLVVPNRAFTRPDAAGEWRLPDLPEGSYVVRAWAPGLRELRQETVVARRGETVIRLHW